MNTEIDNAISEVLDGNALTLALDFVSYLRASGMQFERGKGYWQDKYYWLVRYMDEYVCFILIDGCKEEGQPWVIWSDDSDSAWYADYPLDERMKELAYANTDVCANCGSCGGGTSKTIFGRRFDNICRTTFRFNDPNVNAVECAKKLVDIRKNDIHANAYQQDCKTNLVIKPLTPDLASDFFDFFDNRAFTDDSPEGPCYCQRFQMTREEEEVAIGDMLRQYGGFGNALKHGLVDILRELARQQIASGALHGYLAFIDGVSVGWCNANDKANFPEESANRARLYAPAEKREKIVVCFEIAPEYRGKGIAAALLQRVIDDAIVEGYAAIESLPRKRDGRYEWDFAGPIQLYKKAGFVTVEEREKDYVMRKELNSV
ncbi:MAG: GNAT family N-acetyltransferase [Oscillospiraceae bacterium]|jgi:GNAT superfamily N-acetyltransferase|nr:GNAT family N-acetyltransferase [Oscillospiraceae bacterium]